MKHFGRHSGRRASVRVLVSLVGVTLIVGLTALPASASTVANFTPKCGVVGTSVAITGTGFTGATRVIFNTTDQTTFTGLTDTTVTAAVPSGATTGKITVDATGSDTASTADFTVETAPAAPTITSFTPTAGPIGTSVTITGTKFCGTTAVKFNTTTATSVTVNSATSITATVPTGATTGKISVTNTIATATSTNDFVVVAPPTIASFTPAFGPVGTSVKITGTNFSGPGFTTSSVKFNNVTATFVVNSATQITATVPTGATTGKISVTTPGGTISSAANFTVSIPHSRSVTLSLKKHLVAKGVVNVGDGFTACEASVPVKIQRKTSGGWNNVGSATTTASGSYSKKLKDKTGKYRAQVKKFTPNAGVDVCSKATSPVRKHTH
jgi:large repetitive protein